MRHVEFSVIAASEAMRQLRSVQPDDFWIALVTFERTADWQTILPEGAQGACGWMIAFADSEEAVLPTVQSSLAEVGLKLVAIDEVQQLTDADEVESEFDGWLAANLRNADPLARTIWGTLEIYAADGEA